jgi:hypothetical protein
MLVTDFTRRAIAYRRQRRDLLAKGYEQITCKFGVGDLWQLDRGYRYDWRLTDCVLGVDGKSVYVKAEPPVAGGQRL